VFEIYRSAHPGVDDGDAHVMTIDDTLAVKQTYTEKGEVLTRDPYTPYAFFAKRHFEVLPFPDIRIGDDPVEAENILIFPDDKVVEVHSGELGLFDGHIIYIDYSYQAIPVFDDHVIESGKTYNGPPATGLQVPTSVTAEELEYLNEIHLTIKPNLEPITYYYRIYAKDTDGNISPWSDELHVTLTPSEVFYRIQRSKDQKTWENVYYGQNLIYDDMMKAMEVPANLYNLTVTPLDSKDAQIQFDNPWYHYSEYKRHSYYYRIRSEDSDGQYTDWFLMNPIDLIIKPKEILIRRKVDNGQVSTKTGIDAIDVFEINESNVNVSSPILTYVDDQLTDATVYGYTFFLTDVLGMEANPVYRTSDHTPWANIMLFTSRPFEDVIKTSDFISTFEIADQIIEIGEE
jgi:hypothetical protein